MNQILFTGFSFLLLLIVNGNPQSGDEILKQKNADEDDKQTYLMEKPGVLTFRKGVEIVGRVEKPQVEIILQKERPIPLRLDDKPQLVENIQKPLELKVIFLDTEPVE